MQTLNAIAENIAYKLGDQFNDTLKQSIKETVLDYRAKYIRDDADRNALSDVHFSQVGVIQFETVNILQEFGADFSCISAICDDVHLQAHYRVLKSKKPIPTPVRLKQANRSPFMYVGRVDGSKMFTYTTLEKFPYIRTLPYSLRTIYYTVINNYIYILNNLSQCDVNETLNLCNIMFKGVFEDPREFYNACENGDSFVDDLPFPIGKDMLMSLTNAILKGEYPLVPKDGEQINIKPDDNS